MQSLTEKTNSTPPIKEEIMIPLIKTVKGAPTKLTTILRQFYQPFYRNRTNLNKRKNVAFYNCHRQFVDIISLVYVMEWKWFRKRCCL